MLGTLLNCLVLLLAGRICWGYLQQRARRRGVPLPPGPPRLPLLGNALDMPKKEEWLAYQSLTKQYGDIVYLEALGKPIVIIGSLHTAIELLEKRGANFSGRPQSEMTKLCKLEWPFSRLPYGDAWRARRRAFHSVNLPEQVVSYQAGQMADMHLFLRDLLAAPREVSKHNHFCISSTIMRVVYGLKVQRKNDPLMGILKIFSDFIRETGHPGRFAIEAIPLLRFVPAWMPGAEFKRLAHKAHTFADPARQRPWEELQAALARGEGKSCMASRMLELSYNVPDKEQVCKDAAAVAYLAGSDTTHGTIDNFVIAMMYFPEVQAKAQAEIDRVVGTERLPSFDDRAQLPYIQAMVLETLRWRTITPLALPHTPVTDEVFNGFYIPSGTTIFANAWAMLHDPEVYPDPDEFKPERFLRTNVDGNHEIDPTILDPRTIAFGFGRRICPGRHMAENTLWAAIVSLLAAFDIKPVKDTDGNPPKIEWTSGVLSAPRPFDSMITPRTARARVLVEEAAEAAEHFD